MSEAPRGEKHPPRVGFTFTAHPFICLKMFSYSAAVRVNLITRKTTKDQTSNQNSCFNSQSSCLKSAFLLQVTGTNAAFPSFSCWITWLASRGPLRTPRIWRRMQVCRSSRRASRPHQRPSASGHLREVRARFLSYKAVFSFLTVYLPITGLSFGGRGKAAQQQKQPVRTKHAHTRNPASAIVLSRPGRICCTLV